MRGAITVHFQFREIVEMLKAAGASSPVEIVWAAEAGDEAEVAALLEAKADPAKLKLHLIILYERSEFNRS